MASLNPNFSKMSKADLINECQSLGLSSSGTTKELKERLQQCQESTTASADLDKSDSSRTSECDTAGDKEDPSTRNPVPDKGDNPSVPSVSSDLMLMLQWMNNQQNERRQEEERRRQEEEQRRNEKENRRFELLLSMQREQMMAMSARVSPIHSRNGSETAGVCTASVSRTVSRLRNEATVVMNEIRRERNSEVPNSQVIKVSLVGLQRFENRIEKLLDEKIDLLDNDDEKDELTQQVYQLQKELRQVRVIAETFKEKADHVRSVEARAGPLPQGVVIPTFNGDPMNYPSWWDHFRTLVHENREVSKFWKMRYLLQAMSASASSVLAGKQGLAEEYDDSIKAVQKRFGKEHIIVRHLVNGIVAQNTPSLKDLSSFGDFIESIKTRLGSLEMYKATQDMILLPLIEAKLPSSVRKAWEREVCTMIDKGNVPLTNDLIRFCETEYDALSSTRVLPEVNPKSQDKKMEIRTKNTGMVSSAQSLVAEASEISAPNEDGVWSFFRCLCCNKSHKTKDCQIFHSKSKEARRKLIVDNKFCYKCIESKFDFSHKCPPMRCSDCKCSHHVLLSCPNLTQKSETTKELVVISNRGAEILPTVLARASHGNNVQVVRMALDSMSQKTFITAKAAKRLGLHPSNPQTLTVQGFGGRNQTERFGSVYIDLEPMNQEQGKITLEAFVKEGQICAPLSAVSLNLKEYPHLKDLALGDPDIPDGAEVDILIGQAPFQEIMSGKVVRPRGGAKLSQPSAWETTFGYALMGPLGGHSEPNTESACLLSITENQEPDLERFWRLDTMGIIDVEQKMSQEEDRAMKIFKETTCYDGERYTVSLPFKENAPFLSNNYHKVAKQLEATEKRLLRDPKLRQRYTDAIDDYVRRGYSRELTEEEIDEIDKGESYFIPHHAVIKESRESTKVRIVFNASDPDKNGNSLNSCLLPGPGLHPDIGGVLIRFRAHEVALSGDIEKMFLQTKVNPACYRYQQYLWRDCEQSVEPRRYVMTRLMFGISSSPFCAIATTQEHARMEAMVQQYPEVCARVKDSLYVDDLHVGGDSNESVVKLYKDASAFFEKGGWHLTKFASNSREVMEAIPSEERHPHAIVDMDQENPDVATTLGLKWNTELDEFSIKVTDKVLNIPEVITKHVVLRIMSAIFDIFGFISPFVIRAKILIQDIWKLSVSWDDPLPHQIVQIFSQWANELEKIKNISIPRYLFNGGINRLDALDIHGFCDASEKAYGCVIYVRFTNEEGHPHTRLVMSKARVAPLKTQTVARLELLGAVLLAKLAKYIVEQMNISINKVHLWTDSEITLAWIRKPGHTWKQFVRNRVEQIQESFGPERWGFCPGNTNPADVISRGTTLAKLKNDNLYWHGPEWLLLPEHQWPNQESNLLTRNERDECSKEKVKAIVTNVDCPSEPPDIVSRSSSFSHTKRVIAWMLRWKYRNTNTSESEASLGNSIIQIVPGSIQELDSDELHRAETVLIRNLQQRNFYEEKMTLEDGNGLPSKSKLLAVDPFIGETGLLQVGGRLQNADLPELTRNPIILPDKDYLTELIVKDVHEKAYHAPIETTLSLLRQKYYVIHGRQAVRRVIHKCLICKRFKTKAMNQKMGNLPEHRVTVAPAFADVGIDFTGVLHIKEGEKIRKGYICVFTCAHSRMVHFELSLSLTTEEFLQALRRFLNRRGWCRSIESDNQTSFQKANKLLQTTFEKKLWKNFDREQIEKFAAENGIKWRFITERSPFRGAYWERINRSLKEPLRKVLGNALLTYTELYTILTDIEAVMNQRPLSYHGSDPKDPEPITPSQLAIGRDLKELPPICGDGKVSISRRYRYLQTTLNHFWKRWIKEYLPNLQIRSRWKTEEKPIKVGDVVFIADDKTSRPSWPLGRISKVILSRDGLIRTAQVKTKNGLLTRPIQKIHLLNESTI